MLSAADQPAPTRRFQAVLFDFDHTLFQFDDSIAWLQAALQEAGDAMPRPAMQILYDRLRTARSAPDVVAEQLNCQLSTHAHRAAHYSWFRRAGADDPVAEALYRRLTDAAGWTPYPDALSTVAAVRSRGVAVAVVSNVGWDIRPTFAYHGMGAMVDIFALSCEHGSEKPGPELFLAACSALAVSPTDALMVGDDPINDAAAVRSGLHVLLLPDRPRGSRRGLAAVLDLLGPDGVETPSPAPQPD